MANLTMALMVVLSINVILFLGQASIIEINEDATVFYNPQDSLLCNFEAGNCNSSAYVLETSEADKLLPDKVTSVSDEGNIFTDIFGSIKQWFLDKTGLAYLIDLLKAPNNFLNAIGLPGAFSFALSAMWYGLTLFLVIAFIWGRSP